MLILCRKTMYCEVKERDFVLKHHAGRGFFFYFLSLGSSFGLGGVSLKALGL